jgi:hypothetical protein
MKATVIQNIIAKRNAQKAALCRGAALCKGSAALCRGAALCKGSAALCKGAAQA